MTRLCVCVCAVDLESGTITTDSNNTQTVQISTIFCMRYLYVLLDIHAPATHTYFVAVYHMAHEWIVGRQRGSSCTATFHQHKA